MSALRQKRASREKVLRRAALMPFLELVPLVSTLPALAFVAFGIALLLRDGIAAVIGLAVTIQTLVIVVQLGRLIF